MTPWEGIHEFVSVVEAGSFTAAAARLGSSTSHVSKQISRLEERLHTRLLHRSTRRVVATMEGEIFYQRCKRIIESLQHAEEDICLNRDEARGHLHIVISSNIGARPLAPVLARFLSRHPQLTLETSISDACGDLIAPGHDLAIWSGQLTDSSLVARRLCDLRLQTVASPAYLARHGTPQHPEDLRRHNCLTEHEGDWQFSNGEHTVRTLPGGNWRSPHASVRLAAACSDAGIALLPAAVAADAVGRGELLPVLAPWCQRREPLWAVYPQNRYLAARLRLLLDFLATELSEPTDGPVVAGTMA